MGEEHKIAKRVVELSMQLANSRADVENLRMRIKAVDKEHEQLKKDRADMVDRFDAALRRAKAEVLRDLRNTFAPCATGDTRENVDGCGNYDDYYAAGGNDAYRDVVKEIDARAAQIEEGE